jgi:GTP-binding protein EngB required for normal cell division
VTAGGGSPLLETPQENVPPHSPPVDAEEIRRLGALAQQAGLLVLAEEGERLAERASVGSYYVACLGQFKRGKSSLLNSLLGKSVLPTGVAPVTSVATVVRFGPYPRARVRFADGWQKISPEALTEYVTEASNPGNRKGALAVEVFDPSPLLAGGMCLVDTPGIGSVVAENTAATRDFVPQVDAALVVLGGDPPISGDELTLIRQVAEHVDRFVFVLSKADRLAPSDLEQARSFTLQVLERALPGEPVDIFEVSASERLAGGKATRDWGALEQRLAELAHGAGRELALLAARRGLERLRRRLLAALEERRLALVRPVEESEARVASLGSLVSAAEQSLSLLGHVFRAEEERLRQALEAQRQRFLERMLPEARSVLEVQLSATRGRAAYVRRESQVLAERVARSCIDSWVAEEVPASERLYQQASARLVSQAEGFLARTAVQPGLEALAAPLDLDLGFRVRSHRYFTDLLYVVTTTPLAWALDRVLPRALRMRPISRQAGQYVERLLEANSSRVQFDLDERIRESGRRLESELRARLKEVISAAQAALDSARRTHAAGEAAVEAELKHLEFLRQNAQTSGNPVPQEQAR